MSHYNVTEGAKCKCTLGTNSAVLGFPSCETVEMRGSMALNINDYQFVVTFGSCQREKTHCEPCTPEPDGPWSNEAPKVFVGEWEALVDDATLHCVFGGDITITDPGPDNIYTGDELFVGADGRAISARGTREEVEKMKEAEGVKEFVDDANYYRDNPVLSLLNSLGRTVGDANENKRRRPLPRGNKKR